MFLTAIAAFGQAQTEVRVLQPNQVIELKLNGGETHIFEFPMKAGQFAQVEVVQSGIDVAVSLFGADGKLSATLDGKGGRLWRETVSCLAEAKGNCRVEVVANQKDAPAGSYTIKLTEPRKAAPQDRDRLLAERALDEGRQFYETRQYDKALAKYEAAAALWQKIGDKYWETISLFSISLSKGGLSKYSEAVTGLENALSVLREYKDRVGESKVTNALGYAFAALNRYEKALDYFEQTSAILREIKDRHGERNMLKNLGDAYSNFGQYEKARGYYEQILTINREIKDRNGEGETLGFLGNIYEILSQYEKARDYYERSLAIFREIKNRQGESSSLLGLGNVYYIFGQHEKARDVYEQSLIIKREIKDRRGEGETLISLGAIHDSLGQYEKARDVYEQSLIIKREIKDRNGEGAALNNLGSAYNNLGQYEKARVFYEQALTIFRETKFRNGEGVTLIGLGLISYNLGQYEKARVFYEQALAIKREIKDRNGEGAALANLGTAYHSLEQNKRALDYFEQALAIFRETKDRKGEGIALNGLAILYNSLGQNEKARDYYGQSLAIFREIKYPLGEGESLYNLMLIQEKPGGNQLSILYGKQSINVFQEIRGNIKGLDKESQKSFLQIHEKTYRTLADLLIAEGRFPEAQAVLDLLKEEEFGQLARRSGEPLFVLPYSRAEEEALKVIERLAAAGRELGDLRAKGDKLTANERKRFDQLEQTEIPAANKALRLAIEALAKAAPDVEKVLAARMKDNVQNILPELGAGTVALYTVVGKTKGDEKTNKSENEKTSEKINVGWILLVTPEFRKAYPIDVKDLEKTVFDFRSVLLDSDSNPQALAGELYKKLFLQTSDKQKQTLAADLEIYLGKHKNKTLMWSLDGVLRYVPMAALHDGKSYLVEKYRNVVFNTASLGSLKDAVKPNWEVVGLGVSEKKTVKTADGRTIDFAALEDAERELRSLIKEKDPKDTDGILPGTIKLNKDFGKQALFEGARTDAPVIHIASHFSFNPAREEASFLLLGDGGQLEMIEFQDYPNLFQNVDLLSLSACDTATGGSRNETNGKEVEGFAYVAQTLGAKSVMASLWRVSDEGTRELMLKFYEIRKANPKMSKGEALRQAQLALLKGAAGKPTAEKSYAHPYFWSPFILIGNWQ
jgi:CHAT domain-containing protein/tetratricopeptide (TPR) repeat protein